MGRASRKKKDQARGNGVPRADRHASGGLALACEAVGQASEMDRLWFDQHPDQDCRIRDAVPGEFGPEDPDVEQTLVTQVRRGIRHRAPWTHTGRLLADDVLANWKDADPTPLRRQALEAALVFDVTNVRDYLDAVMPLKKQAHLVRDIPNAAPLAPAWWMESGKLVGFLFLSPWDPYDHTADPLGIHTMPAFDVDVSTARWIYLAYPFARIIGQNGPEFMHYYYGYALAVAADGAILDYGCMAWHSDAHRVEEGPTDTWWSQRFHDLYTAVMATCFAHCRNVEVRERTATRRAPWRPRPDSAATAATRVSYKTLDIGPLTPVLRDEGRIETTGLTKALHVCRAHFAHYTEERPLFGKYTGTFYVPMHVRGRREAGLALKDYRVLPADVLEHDEAQDRPQAASPR